MYRTMHAGTSPLLHATYSNLVKTPALSGVDQPGAAMLSKEACVMHSDSRIECHPDWCRALAPSLILHQLVIWPEHKFSHFQVMLFQNRCALQSIIWPVYLSAHEARIHRLHLRTAPVQVQESNRVCAIGLCPAIGACLVDSTCEPAQKAVGCHRETFHKQTGCLSK